MQGIKSAFANPVHQSQQVFRQVLGAMARPGNIRQLEALPEAAPGLSPAATAVCLALADFETPVWLDDPASAASSYLVFHCSTPITKETPHASFAVIGNALELEDFAAFNTGTDEYPETSTTLIIETSELTNDSGRLLAGPGIEHTTTLHVEGVASNFWEQVAENHLLFPRGVDLILTCGDRVAALPRSVRVLEA
jgi:alpha-D-ribose 1-methylphosphonate 5-triphosphate synthase subunit PhnH